MNDLLDELRELDPQRAAAPDPARSARMDATVERFLAGEPPPGPAPVRAHRRRRRTLAFAVPSAAVAAIAAALLLAGQERAGIGPVPASASPSVVLRALAERSALTAAETSGRYAYTRTLDYVSHMRPGGVVVVIPHETEEWIAPDGTGVARNRMREDQARYPTPEDRERSRPLPALPPFDGTPYRLRELRYAGLSVRQVRELPTDPAALRGVLERSGLKAERPVVAGAAQLLRAGFTPEPVRQALFALLRAEPGAKVEDRVEDPAGRSGIAVTFTGEAWDSTFLFDRETGALIASRSIGHKEVPGRDIDDWSLTLERGWRDSAPEPVERPNPGTTIRVPDESAPPAKPARRRP